MPPRAALVALACLPLCGCFTALSRWGGNRPPASVTIGAATADIVTSPLQIPVLTVATINHASSRPTQEQRDRNASVHAANAAERERVIALAQTLQSQLETDPALLADDAF